MPDALERFLDLVAEAPQRLVANTSHEALAAHVTDAYNSLPLLEGETGPLLDVGAGAGFPGVPLLLARPDLHGTLLDSRERRCAHLREAIAVTDMTERVEVVHLRAEDYARGVGREAYGIVVARALAPPPVAIELCLPFLRCGGIFVLHAGAVVAEDLAVAAEALGGTVEQIVPVAGFDQRSQVVVRKLGVTSEVYPRRVGVATRHPLVRHAD